MKKIFLVPLFAVMVLLVFSSVYADDRIDLGVGDPGLLPTSPFYFLKEIKRGIQRFFAFTKESKWELELKITNEKAAELARVVEKNPQREIAVSKALENYKKSRERLISRMESLKDVSQNQNIGKLIDKTRDQMSKHQDLFGEILEKFEDEPLSDIEDIKEVNEDISEGLKFLDDIENELNGNENEDEKKEESKKGEKHTKIFCGQIYEPVCGSNGKTYSNICFAKDVGVTVKHEGECNPASLNKPVAANEATVIFNGQEFSPREVTVRRGGKVTWANKSSKDVWVASAMHPTHLLYPGFDALKGGGPGESYSFVFEKVGSWNYHDHLNSSIFGKIIVAE